MSTGHWSFRLGTEASSSSVLRQVLRGRPSYRAIGSTSVCAVGQGPHERWKELQLLEERVADLGEGSGCVVVIEGRAGAGKTALLDGGIGFGRAAGYDVRAVRAREHERNVSGATIRRLAPADGGDAATFMGEVVRAADTGSMIVAVDDLHLADEESIAALLGIADRIEDLALLMMVALRSGEWPAEDPRLDRLRGSASATVLRPAPLSAAGVARVLEDHWGFAPSEEIVEGQVAWTAGNPFLVTAVARMGPESDAIPESVVAAVSRELRRLSPAEAALARALSILGPGAPLRRVARLAELRRTAAERAADRLARLGLIAPGDPLRFLAPIEGAAIADAIEPFARARGHRLAAAMLFEEAADTLEIADQLLLTSAAGDPRVVATLRAAADRALTDGRPDRAVRYLERALDEPPPDEERDETVLGLVKAEALCGKATSVDRVERILDRLADGRPRVEALRQLATLQFLRNEPDRAAATLQRGLDHAGDDEQLREALLGEYLAAASFAPQLRADASTRFGEVMQAIGSGGPLPTDPGLLVQVVSAMAAGGAPRKAVLEIVEALLRTNPTWDGPPFGLFADWISSACIYTDELDLAEQVSMRSNQAACDAGDVVRQCLTSYWLGLARLHQGRLDEAVLRFEAALQRQDAGWTSAVPWTAAALCVAQLERGRPEDAAGALHLAKDADPDGFHTGVVLEARGHLAMARGDPATALRHYEASGRHLADTFFIDAPTLITWRSNAVFALRADNGDLRRARALAEEELTQARAMGAPRQQARALRAAAAARPGTSKAVRLLREAHEITAARSPRLEHLHVLTDLGGALIGNENPAEAREPLHEALETSEACGAGPVAARARSLLRAAGTRPRRTARSGFGALTAGELHVAALAATGHSNRSIADVLTLSERTVESHLYNAFSKLGIHRREELASHLAQGT